MSTSRSSPFRKLAGLALLLPLLAACDSKDSTGPDQAAAGPVGEALDILGDVAAEFVVDNEPAFNSLAFFVPQIASIFAAPVVPAEIGPASASAQCFAPEILGVTFDFDFGENAYTASGLTGAPPTGVRFILFEIEDGEPTQGSQLGYVDIICNAFLPNFDLSLEVVVDGATALSLTAFGTIDLNNGLYTVNVSGYIGSASSAKQLPFGDTGGSSVIGTLGGPANFLFDFSVLPEQAIRAEFGRSAQPGTFSVHAAVRQQSENAWYLNAQLFGSSAASIEGALRFETIGEYNPETNELEGGGSVYVACFSGSYENPSVSPGSGCTGEDGQAISLSQAELAGVKAGYDGLRRLSEALSGLVGEGMNVLASQLVGL